MRQDDFLPRTGEEEEGPSLGVRTREARATMEADELAVMVAMSDLSWKLCEVWKATTFKVYFPFSVFSGRD